jgi:hypothetical protein
MITSPRSPPKVLIVTGGYLSARDEGIGVALWKQVVQSRHSRHAWLEAKVKATIAEPILTARWHAWRHHRRVSPALRALLSAQDTLR